MSAGVWVFLIVPLVGEVRVPREVGPFSSSETCRQAANDMDPSDSRFWTANDVEMRRVNGEIARLRYLESRRAEINRRAVSGEELDDTDREFIDPAGGALGEFWKSIGRPLSAWEQSLHALRQGRILDSGCQHVTTREGR